MRERDADAARPHGRRRLGMPAWRAALWALVLVIEIAAIAMPGVWPVHVHRAASWLGGAWLFEQVRLVANAAVIDMYWVKEWPTLGIGWPPPRLSVLSGAILAIGMASRKRAGALPAWAVVVCSALCLHAAALVSPPEWVTLTVIATVLSVVVVALSVDRWWTRGALAGWLVIGWGLHHLTHFFVNAPAGLPPAWFVAAWKYGTLAWPVGWTLIVWAWVRTAPRHPAWACAECGYDLRGAAAGRCPECGDERRARSGGEARSERAARSTPPSEPPPLTCPPS